jgi:hypothetical protein
LFYLNAFVSCGSPPIRVPTWIDPVEDFDEFFAKFDLVSNLFRRQVVVQISGHVSVLGNQLRLEPHHEEVVRVKNGRKFVEQIFTTFDVSFAGVDVFIETMLLEK